MAVDTDHLTKFEWDLRLRAELAKIMESNLLLTCSAPIQFKL